MPRLSEPREVLEPGKVKGGMIRSHLSWIDEHRTPEEKKALLSRLPSDVAYAFSGSVLATTWVPFAWLIQLDRAVVADAGNAAAEILAEMGRYSARINLSTTYRAFTKDSLHHFFERAALLHSQFQDFGKVAYVAEGENSGRLIHRDYTSYSPIFCASAIGYYEGAILAHEAKSPKVHEVSCQCYGEPTCTFELSWV